MHAFLPHQSEILVVIPLSLLYTLLHCTSLHFTDWESWTHSLTLYRSAQSIHLAKFSNIHCHLGAHLLILCSFHSFISSSSAFLLLFLLLLLQINYLSFQFQSSSVSSVSRLKRIMPARQFVHSQSVCVFAPQEMKCMSHWEQNSSSEAPRLRRGNLSRVHKSVSAGSVAQFQPWKKNCVLFWGALLSSHLQRIV